MQRALFDSTAPLIQSKRRNMEEKTSKFFVYQGA